MKIKLYVLLLTVLATLLTSCAGVGTKSQPLPVVLNITGSKVATEMKDWPGYKSLWHKEMKQKVIAAGRQLTIKEGDMIIPKEPGMLVEISINDYSWVSVSTRFTTGVSTDDAWVDVKIRFIDLQSGKQMGELSYDRSSSRQLGGEFVIMTERQVAKICKEIVAEIQKQ